MISWGPAVAANHPKSGEAESQNAAKISMAVLNRGRSIKRVGMLPGVDERRVGSGGKWFRCQTPHSRMNQKT